MKPWTWTALAAIATALLIPEISDGVAREAAVIPKATLRPTLHCPEVEDTSDSNLLPEINSAQQNLHRVDSGRYIVVFKSGLSTADYTAHQEWISGKCASLDKRSGIIDSVRNKLRHAKKSSVQFFKFGTFMGYVGWLPSALIKTIEKSLLVDYVERDEYVKLAQVTEQPNAPWNLERVCNRDFLNKEYSGNFTFDENAGEGVTVYVVDTGINETNPEFEGRASLAWSFSPFSNDDPNGHGTHVAGTIAGKTYGVAKKAKIESLKAFNENGRSLKSTILMAVHYAITEHEKRILSGDASYKGAIINMLLGCGGSLALDAAVAAATRVGITVVSSAGNDGIDACNCSPSRSESSITVGAIDENDAVAWFSNYGRCVDIYAPGVRIQSVSNGEGLSILTGTSMAAPHVTGVVATLLSMQPLLGSEYSSSDYMSVSEVRRKLLKYAAHGVISGLDKESPNCLVYNGAGDNLAMAWNA